jgi:hypothetical protein
MEFPFVFIQEGSTGIEVRGQREASLGTAVPFRSARGGIFGEWCWQDDELRVQVDPFGMFNLFYAEVRGGIMVSTSPIQLIALGASSDLDETALAVFHMLGWYLDEDTVFRHIKVLPPNGRLVWKAGRTTISGSAEYPAEIAITSDQAVVEYARLFAAAVQACWEASSGPMIVPLSGGRDSRHILLESLRQGYRPHHCVTYDPLFEAGFDPEWECAKRITDLFRIEHRRVKTLQSQFSERLRTTYLAHLGTDEHVQFLALHRHLAGWHSLDGIAGDALSRNKNFTQPEKSQMIREGNVGPLVAEMLVEVDRINQTNLEDRLSSMAGRLADHLGPARDRIAACLRQYAHTPDPYSQFLFWTRTRREISLGPSAMLDTAEAIYCPYLDPELARFCMSLPMQVTADGQFHDHVIRHSFPDVRVPYHDELNAILPRPPVLAKAKAIIAAIRASASAFGPTALVSEPADQIAMLASRKHKRSYAWRTYHRVLSAISSAGAAAGFLNRC